MIQRIRYIKKSKGLVSKNVIVSKSGAKYIVQIDLEEMTYTIRNINSQRGYSGGEGVNNLHVLKRHAKKHLEHLGCVFAEKEKRNRTFGKCAKGMTQQQHIKQQAASNKGPASMGE